MTDFNRQLYADPCFYHPECEENEIFITNAKKENKTDYESWKTFRIIENAYDVHGNIVEGYVAFVVDMKEHFNKHQ